MEVWLIFYISQAFEKVKIDQERVKPIQSPLVSFAVERVLPEGAISLLVIAGTFLSQAIVMFDLLVVDRPSIYNAIMGRPSLNKFQAVTSTYHLKMKFPTNHGVGEVKGDQVVARRCYSTTMKEPTRQGRVSCNSKEKLQNGEPDKELKHISIGEHDKK